MNCQLQEGFSPVSLSRFGASSCAECEVSWWGVECWQVYGRDLTEMLGSTVRHYQDWVSRCIDHWESIWHKLIFIFIFISITSVNLGYRNCVIKIFTRIIQEIFVVNTMLWLLCHADFELMAQTGSRSVTCKSNVSSMSSICYMSPVCPWMSPLCIISCMYVSCLLYASCMSPVCLLFYVS